MAASFSSNGGGTPGMRLVNLTVAGKVCACRRLCAGFVLAGKGRLGWAAAAGQIVSSAWLGWSCGFGGALSEAS